MNDDHLETYIEPELEARIVALVLGEASAFEREELERLIEERAELQLFYDRIAKLHNMLRENTESKEDADWTLPAETRNDLLATFAGESDVIEAPSKKERPKPKLRTVGIRVLAAAAILTLLAVPIVMTLSSIATSENRAGTNYSRTDLARTDHSSEELVEYSFFDREKERLDFGSPETPSSFESLDSGVAIASITPSGSGGKELARRDDIDFFTRDFLGGANNSRGFDAREMEVGRGKKEREVSVGSRFGETEVAGSEIQVNSGGTIAFTGVLDESGDESVAESIIVDGEKSEKSDSNNKEIAVTAGGDIVLGVPAPRGQILDRNSVAAVIDATDSDGGSARIGGEFVGKESEGRLNGNVIVRAQDDPTVDFPQIGHGGMDGDQNVIDWDTNSASYGAFAGRSVVVGDNLRTSGSGSVDLAKGWSGKESDAGLGDLTLERARDDADINVVAKSNTLVQGGGRNHSSSAIGYGGKARAGWADGKKYTKNPVNEGGLRPDALGIATSDGVIPDTSYISEKDLLASVTDRPSGTLSFGAGVSTIDNFTGFAEVTEQNFESPRHWNFRPAPRGGEPAKNLTRWGIEKQSESSSEFGLVTNTEDEEVDGKKVTQVRAPTATTSAIPRFAMPDESQPEMDAIMDLVPNVVGGVRAFGNRKTEDSIALPTLDAPNDEYRGETRAWSENGESVPPSSVARLAPVYDNINVLAGVDSPKVVNKESASSGGERSAARMDAGSTISVRGRVDQEQSNVSADGATINSGSLTGALTELRSHGNLYATAINNGGVVRSSGAARQNGRARLHMRGGSQKNVTMESQPAESDNLQASIDSNGAIRAQGYNFTDGRLSLANQDDASAVTNTGQLAANSSADSGGSVVINDQESKMLNRESKAGGVVWNSRRLVEGKDMDMDGMQPVQHEWQRYPGHPASGDEGAVQVGNGGRSTEKQPDRAYAMIGHGGIRTNDDDPEIEELQTKLAAIRATLKGTETEVAKSRAYVATTELERNGKAPVAKELAALRKEQSAGIIRGEFQSTVAKAYNKRGFVLVEGGHEEGVVENSQLNIYRKGQFVGKLLVTSVEDERSVADIIPGSVPPGFSVEAGDTVVKTTRTHNSIPRPDSKVLAKESDASKTPFSTFSLHVSDVSFKLAQASLAKGEWPDQERIRIEEFVNAFDYDDPLPSSDERVAASIEQAIHPTMQQRNVLRIALRTAAAGRNSATPLSLTFLLDSSGSMERFDRQETLQRAFSLLAAQLKEHDQVTLISFARQARLVAEKIPGTRCAELVDLVSQLPEEGGTNIEAALRLAFEKAKEHRGEKSQNRIVLLTDGAANLGDANPERLSELVQSMRDAGVAFDAAGIGAEGLNDEILEALTRKGDGRYYLLDRPQDADANFARQIAGALRPAAGNVKVQVEFNPLRVGKYQLHGFEKHRLKKEDFKNDKVDAAELAAAEAGVALYQVETLPEGQGDIGQVSVRFKDVASGRMIEKRWPIPYQASLPHLFNASESIRVATVATLVASKLKDEPLGSLSQWDDLAKMIGSLSPETQKRERIAQLNEMISKAQAISASGKSGNKTK